MRAPLLEFITRLRAAGLRISVAESLDAAPAVAAAGLERAHLREALAATLVKDEADRPCFDREFERFFRAGTAQPGQPRTGRSRVGMTGGHGGSGQAPPDAPNRAKPEPAAAGPGARADPGDDRGAPPAKVAASARGEDQAGSPVHEQAGAGSDTPAGERAANRHETLTRPFSAYGDLEYERALDLLGVLRRRIRVRLGRRRRNARRGRVDFRRTIRAAMQSGGAMLDLRMRARRPRHVDLLVLADISGSVRYAAALMLALAAGVRAHFGRVDTLVFIDRIAEAGFEQGHLTMAPALDLHARSDFGRAMGELIAQRRRMLTPATVVVILGDGRNNRRPARADLLAEIRRLTRAVIWLNPEAPERWGTGDSAMANYARVADRVIECTNLHILETTLSRLTSGLRPPRRSAGWSLLPPAIP